MYRSSTYMIDYDAVDEAKELLGIKKPVEIMIKYMIHRQGTYLSMDWERQVHRISLASCLTPYYASGSLWHELTHAKQKEEWGYEFGDEYDRQLEVEGLGRSAIALGQQSPRLYQKIPFEREAFRTEKEHRCDLLTKPRPQPKKRLKTLPSGKQLVDNTMYLLNV